MEEKKKEIERREKERVGEIERRASNDGMGIRKIGEERGEEKNRGKQKGGKKRS